jgi:hypothetical protein
MTPAAAAKATAAKSSTTEAITGAALKVLEALALLSAAEPVLGLAVQILHLRTPIGSVEATSTGSIEAPFTRTVLAACAI